MVRKSKTGEKFGPKYGVKPTQIYEGDPGPDKLRIPPPGHFLYDPSSPMTHDELRVRQIDKDGHMNDALEVWTDPDSGVLWTIDGRGRLLDVREVNRRRKKDGRAPVKPRLAPLKMTEAEAIARISIKNTHRRQIPPSAYAFGIDSQRKAGWAWDKIAEHHHIESKAPEQWCRLRLPLAFCEPEVREAFDAGLLQLPRASKFGGREVDGSGALGRKEQLALLDESLAERAAPAEPLLKPLTPKTRARIFTALTNGASEHLRSMDREVANAVAAALALIEGDADALSDWPEVAAVVQTVMAEKAERAEKRAKAQKRGE
jgi:hypothetical protein